MTGVDHRALGNALLPAVLAAGRIEMAYYRGSVDVETKADQSPVTAADREAEVVLLEALAKAAPGVPVVAEESAAAGSIPTIADRFFLVDPLDGTKEFVKKRDEFTINVGLVVEGVPRFGIVYAPAIEELYLTLSATRAVMTRVSPDAPVRSLDDLAFTTLASRTADPAGLVALESRSHRSAATDGFLAGYAIREVKAAGSSLKFCLIARGEADLYPRIGETCEWDTAAAHAVLAAAGGSIVTLDGAPLRYGKAERGFLNPHFVAWGGPPVAPRG